MAKQTKKVKIEASQIQANEPEVKVCTVTGGECVESSKYAAKYRFTIHCKGHFLDGKSFIKEISSKSSYYLANTEDPVFDTSKEFFDHYKLKMKE